MGEHPPIDVGIIVEILEKSLLDGHRRQLERTQRSDSLEEGHPVPIVVGQRDDDPDLVEEGRRLEINRELELLVESRHQSSIRLAIQRYPMDREIRREHPGRRNLPEKGERAVRGKEFDAVERDRDLFSVHLHVGRIAANFDDLRGDRALRRASGGRYSAHLGLGVGLAGERHEETERQQKATKRVRFHGGSKSSFHISAGVMAVRGTVGGELRRRH